MPGATFTYSFDDRVVMDALARLAAAGRQPRALLDIIGERLVISTKERFDSNVSPDGSAWPALNAAYAEVRRPGPMLVQSGALRDSISFESAGRIVRVGSPMIYAAVHQFGAVIRPKTARALAFHMGIHNSLVLVKKVRIPARPYLGISAGDEAGIIEDAVLYLEKTLG